MKCITHAILFAFILTSVAATPSPVQTRAAEPGAPPMPTHPTPIVVGDMFQFVEGAWAEYEIFDKIQDTTFTMRMSVLGPQQVRRTWFSRRRPYRWLEFDVHMPGEPRVLINYLARETPEGPGEPHEMIIQIEEFENPIRLRRRWLRGNEDEIVDAGYEWTRQRVDEEAITHGDRSFSAWRVQAKAEDGTTVEAVVSEELPPFGLYFAETPEQRMTLRDWGTDARSTITGQPLGLTRWIARQVREGMQEQ